MLPCLMSARLEGYECYTVCSVALRAGSTLIVPRGSRAIRESRVDRVPGHPVLDRRHPVSVNPVFFPTNFFVFSFPIHTYIFLLFFYLTVSFYLSISYIFFLMLIVIAFWKSICLYFFFSLSLSFFLPVKKLQ